MDDLIAQAQQDMKKILDIYGRWWRKFEHGDTSSTLYHDLTEFVNARMETVDSCRILLEKERVSDVLGLNRSLLENYLLYILMCRGKKFFRLRVLKRSEKIHQVLEEARKHVGSNALVAVEEHPTLKRHLMYIYEGLATSADEGDFIPYHFFSIQEFSPEAMRLNENDYFTYDYGDVGDEIKERDLRYKKEQTFMYQHYLSYDALLNCLRINGIVDEPASRRIDAHYTFLGRYLHPTHDAFRSLRERNNHHSEITIIGTEYPYERSAVLLGYAYSIHNAIGFLEELANVLDHASAEHFKSSGSEEIHGVIDQMKRKYSYLWYIFNEPSDYAKFNYAVNCLSDENFAAADNDYRKIASSIVTFDKDIYGSFSSAMGGWSNRRVGTYKPPYALND